MPIFEGIMQAVIEPVLMVVLAVPGAFIRWVISRLWLSKRTLKEFVKEDPYANGIVGMLLYIVIGIIIAKSK